MTSTAKAATTAAILGAAALVGANLKWADRAQGPTETDAGVVCVYNEAVVLDDAGAHLERIETCGDPGDGGILPDGVRGRAFYAGGRAVRQKARGAHRSTDGWECATAVPGAVGCEERVCEPGGDCAWKAARVCTHLYPGLFRGACTPKCCHDVTPELPVNSVMPKECRERAP
jgi:hypothetical protein